jgi:FtsP/CotA-like multicopper oxidase with cupredoxin domain
MHTHLVDFQVLSRQKLDVKKYDKAYQAAFPGGAYIAGYGPPLPYGNCLPGSVCGGNPNPAPYLKGRPVPPAPYEQGWKDTVKSNPGEVIRIAIRWAPNEVPVDEVEPGMNLFSFDPTAPLGVLDDGFGYPGGPGYVWHCHIIDHEDNEMMKRYDVTP